MHLYLFIYEELIFTFSNVFFFIYVYIDVYIFTMKKIYIYKEKNI